MLTVKHIVTLKEYVANNSHFVELDIECMNWLGEEARTGQMDVKTYRAFREALKQGERR